MGQVDGLIIPRSYNDYFSRSDPAAFHDAVKGMTDSQLDTASANPIQNKVVAGAVNSINAVIPAQASAQNQLADKNFVNDEVSTNTAVFRGTFNSVADLEAYAGTKTNNDYAFVVGTDSAGNTVYNRYKYVDDGETTPAWVFEYALNNSSFTAAEWAAIQSGITAAKVSLYDQLFAASLPIGIIMPYMGASAPSSAWLVCDGTTFDETEYAELYALLGSNVLPDLQECTIVGIGHNRTNIFDSSETNPSTQQVGTQVHDEYNLGQFKDDQLQDHTHAYLKGQTVNRDLSGHWVEVMYNPSSTAQTGTVDTAYRSGATTRGRQVGVNFIIKAKI